MSKTDVFRLNGTPEEVLVQARAQADTWAGDDTTKLLVASSFRDDLDRQYQWLQDNVVKKIQSEQKFEQETNPDLKKRYQEEVFILDMHVKQLEEGFAAQVNQYAHDMVERYRIVMQRSGKRVTKSQNSLDGSEASSDDSVSTDITDEETCSDSDDESSAGGHVNHFEDAAATRAKQQRLLLLWHASKCKYDRQDCPVTPHCSITKRIWAHIAQCRNPRCEEKDCGSSWYMLLHYKNCKNKRCVVCWPVRMAIRRSVKTNFHTNGKD